jgi:plastocyanin
VLRNLDDRNYFVGPFTVRANETVSETFRVAGAYRGACTLNPSDEIKIVVS